jgi:DNA-binding transcriptional MerR regulator
MKLSEFKLDSIPYEKRNEVVRQNPEYFGMVNVSTLEPLFTRGDVGIDLRKIYHWERDGLLPIKNENREWRQYSFVEYVWLKIIEQLRALDVGLKTIHKIKDELFDISEEMFDGLTKVLTDPQYSYLQEREDFKAFKKLKRAELAETFRNIGICQLWTFVGATMHMQAPATLLVNNDGILGFFLWNETNKTEKLATFLELLTIYPIAIQINIFDIVRQFLKNDRIDVDQYYKLDLLTENEKIIIDLIRDRKFSEVTIYQKNGEIDRIATKERKAVKELTHRIFGTIKKGDFKKIVIDVEDGNVVTYLETNSIKVKAKR